MAELLQGLKHLAEREPRNAKVIPPQEERQPLMYTTRTETDGRISVTEGTLPKGLNGVFYTMYPVGSVNSGGLPYPPFLNGKANSEYGTPIMNGDGFVVSIRFDGSPQPPIKSRLIKTPCYFADYNTRAAAVKSSPDAFINFGLSRMSMTLGARNLLNTAVIPVKFKDSNPFLLATYDVGRPFILDPKKLKLESPLGFSSDWVPATPAFLNWPFPVVQTTAHPSFDPNTEELFSVNYSKASTASEYFIAQRTAYYLNTHPDLFRIKLTAFAEKLIHDVDASSLAQKLMDFFKNLDFNLTGEHPTAENLEASADTSVWLMRWKGEELIEKWMLVDAQGGNAIQITECMHQTSLTEDYIVLTQAAFKFSLDLLINNPFPCIPQIDMLIRKILAHAMLPYTDCYIVKRSELTAGGGKAKAYKIAMSAEKTEASTADTEYPIPVETIHYSCDYSNPGGKITLYGIHNSSSCVAEWIRPYDKAKISGKPADSDLIGMFALGSMDINRIGKWVIDANTLSVDTENSKQYFSPGKFSAEQIVKEDQNADIGPNTWTLGLYTYRDMLSPHRSVAEIKKIWFIANGADPDYLTEFIYDLYKDAADRILPVNDVLTYTGKGIPQTLVQIDCATMNPSDHFQFPYGTYIRSLQYIPNSPATPGLDPQMDGNILCTMQVPADQGYRSEYWVFDAAKISSGPVCKMTFDGIQFCFTLHTTWMETADDFNFNYNVDVRTDYNNEISTIFSDPTRRAAMIQFFEQNVYTDWYLQKAK
jgi:carotenoid cleavage dioxygenase-like enzyme